MNTIEATCYAIEYIEKNLKSNITLSDIAKKAYISPAHLQRLFKEYTKLPVMEYVRKRRLLLSLELLLETDLRVCDISAELSLEYEASFIRAFKAEFGMTPKLYRKRYQALPQYERIRLLCISSIESQFINID